MDHANQSADHQRRVLDFALDTLGLQHARPEAERTLSEFRLLQTVVASAPRTTPSARASTPWNANSTPATPTSTPSSARLIGAPPAIEPASPASDLVWSSR